MPAPKDLRCLSDLEWIWMARASPHSQRYNLIVGLLRRRVVGSVTNTCRMGVEDNPVF